LGWGVVLKATSPRLRQRPDLAGVWRNIETAAEMQHAWRSLIATVGSPADAGYVVQRMAGHGVPLTIRSMEDPLFGPIVSFGVAGIASELLDDWAYRIPPLTDIDAAEMVREIKAAPLLLGYGGGGEVDLEAVEELVARVAELKNDLPEVEMLDLTLALAGSFGVRMLGAAGRVGKVSEGRAEEYTRRLTPVPGEGDARES
jgi:ATP-grasp domain